MNRPFFENAVTQVSPEIMNSKSNVSPKAMPPLAIGRIVLVRRELAAAHSGQDCSFSKTQGGEDAGLLDIAPLGHKLAPLAVGRASENISLKSPENPQGGNFSLT
jgi:hypothetical protein